MLTRTQTGPASAGPKGAWIDYFNALGCVTRAVLFAG